MCLVQGSARTAPVAMRHIILGVLIVSALLAGAALLGAYALPWLRSAQQVSGPEQELPVSNSTSVPQDMNALVRPALHLSLSHPPRLHHAHWCSIFVPCLTNCLRDSCQNVGEKYMKALGCSLCAM